MSGSFVAVISGSQISLGEIGRELARRGIMAILCWDAKTDIERLSTIPRGGICVIDLDETDPKFEDVMDLMFEVEDIPNISVMVNDRSSTRALSSSEEKKFWYDQLAKGIKEELDTGLIDKWNHVRENVIERKKKAEETRKLIEESSHKDVWVIGSSTGGPDMLRRIVSVFKEEMPFAIIIAQHIGKDFVNILAKQVDRYTGMKVQVADEGMRIERRNIYIAPVDKDMYIQNGYVKLENIDIEGTIRPCIDIIMESAAAFYKERTGAVILTGMLEDGAEGCKAVKEYGGSVLIQDPDSCPIPSMPVSVMKNNSQDFIGTPEEIAIKMAEFNGITEKKLREMFERAKNKKVG